jgi:hypothetical protein
MSETVKMSYRPDCDVCSKTNGAVVDSPTTIGPWGYLCEDCWKLYGRYYDRLGIGLGQKIIID